MKEQLNKLMEAEGLTPARFADEIGVQRSSISHILSGRNKPSYDFISKILSRFSGINAEWLITGKGSMIKSEDKGDQAILKQSSIFENKEPKTTQYKEINPNRNPDANEKTKSLINQKQETEDSAKTRNKGMFTNVNNVKYILVFYNDGSFEQFIPRE